MADAIRKQIEQRLQIQKLQEIHAHFDNDKDGFLNHTELSALQTITSGQAISRKKYKAICSSFDCTPAQGLDFRALVMTYASGGEVSIDNDFDAVFGIQRPATQTDSTSSDVTEEKHVNTNGSAKSQDSAEINTVKSLIELLRAGDDPVITRTPLISNDKPSEMMDMLMKQVPSQELLVLAGVANTMGTISESKEISSKGSSSNTLTDIEPGTESKAKKLQAPVEVQEDEEASDPATIVRPMEGIFSSMSKSREKSVMGGSVYEDFLPRDRKEEDECCACSIM
jgi:hypothetical protein